MDNLFNTFSFGAWKDNKAAEKAERKAAKKKKACAKLTHSMICC